MEERGAEGRYSASSTDGLGAIVECDQTGETPDPFEEELLCESFVQQWLTDVESYGSKDRRSEGDPAAETNPQTPLHAGSGGCSAQHRERVQLHMFPLAFVRRPVSRREMLENAAAHTSTQQDWGRLCARRSWDEERPREWADVAREAREAGRKFISA